jgi:outer membrane receptor for monomeric catechols
LPTAVLAQGASQTAPPDTSDAARRSELEDIVVNARKVAENLQDVPVAVTAFSGADLAAQNAQRVQDVARFTPGLVIRPGNASSTSLTIALRGQAQTDVLATLDPSVGTYVDGIYWARAYGLNGSLLDIQSVQVLKGPQGTLFGRNTTGGAMFPSWASSAAGCRPPMDASTSANWSVSSTSRSEIRSRCASPRRVLSVTAIPPTALRSGSAQRSVSGHCSAMARASPRRRRSPLR